MTTSRRIIPLEQPPVIEDANLSEWLARMNILTNAALNEKGDLDWKGPWVQQLYLKGSVVTDGGWLMVANKDTIDKPAPVPTGPAGWRSGEGDAPTWTDETSVATTQLQYGQRYTSAVNGYITGVRIWIDDIVDTITYSVWIVEDPEGIQELSLLQAETSYDTTGWHKLNIGTQLFAEGKTFDIVVQKSNHQSETTGTEPWDYLLPNNPTVPLAGQVTHANKELNHLSISNLDANAVDQSTALSAMQPGDKISAAGVEWTIQSSEDNTTYWTFEVTPPVQGSAGTAVDFKFTTYQAFPINYVNIADHYLAIDTVQGFYSSTGYESAILDEDMYGVDIQVQAAYISDDWDFMAYTDSLDQSGAAATALSELDVAWIQQSSMIINRAETLTSGGGWVEDGRLTIPLDSGYRIRVAFSAKRTDSAGYYCSQSAGLGYNDAGSVTVSSSTMFEESTDPALDTRMVVDGSDVVFEVKGQGGQDWQWHTVFFSREIE